MSNIANIVDVRDIPLTDLEIGKGQVRVSDTSKEISELADSIRKVGLLEPIVVCPSKRAGKFEILTGQRRFLAHKEIGLGTIKAVVLDRSVDPDDAKVISLTENLVRRDLNRRDLIDACTSLYKKYGSVPIVAQETGLPASKVSEYVKYDQLIQPLKKLVDEGLPMATALRAQKAASVSGEIKAEDAVTLAKEMGKMSGVQQKKVVEQSKEAPETSVDKLIAAANTSAKVTQIVVTISDNVHSRLRKYADEEGTTQDDAAATLIQEGLEGRGYVA